jgi:hypothetical protein
MDKEILMSRHKHVAALFGVCLCLGLLSGMAAAQGGNNPKTFSASNTSETVLVTQTGPGITNPSLTNLPPAALRAEATSGLNTTAGVIGTTAGLGFGVFGLSSGGGSHFAATGVAGVASSTSGQTQGVLGRIFSPDGIAVHALSSGGLLFVGTGGPAGSETDKFTVDAAGNTMMMGSLGTAGNAAITGSLQVNGAVNTDSSATIGGSLTTNSGANIGGALNAGPTTINGSLSVSGSISANTSSASFANVTTGSLNAAIGNFNSAVSMATVLTVGGPVNIGGDLHVAGSKSSVVKVSDGRTVALYAVESPENWFEDFGTSQLHHGVVRVTIESVFGETVSPDLSYHVFLTPDGNCRGLYVAKRTASGFEVRELGGGRSNVAFDYRIVAKRKGFEKLRLAEVPAQPGKLLAQSTGLGVSAH